MRMLTILLALSTCGCGQSGGGGGQPIGGGQEKDKAEEMRSVTVLLRSDRPLWCVQWRHSDDPLQPCEGGKWKPELLEPPGIFGDDVEWVFSLTPGLYEFRGCLSAGCCCADYGVVTRPVIIEDLGEARCDVIFHRYADSKDPDVSCR